MIYTDSLPASLRTSGLFCCWKYEERDGKRTKVPYNPRTGGRAQSTNPDTFAPLSTALEAVERGGYDGIGVGVFGTLGAIDIDHCIDDKEELSSMAFDVMDTMQGYTETSPSGKGLRILFTVSPDFQYDKTRYYINNQKAGLEVYIAGSTQKYVTITGNAWTPGLDLQDRSEQLAAVLEKYMRRPAADKPTPSPAPVIPASAADLDDAALIERARQSRGGAAFADLWAGNIIGYKSHSEADIALCNALAWWTNGDAQRVDRLFRMSGLYREEKWNRRQSGSTYGAITVQNAVSTCRGGYDPERPVERGAAPEAVAHTEPWESPVPFDTIHTPDFPVEVLPGPLAAFVECLAESTQTPEEMGGILSLGVLASAFQSRYEVAVTPDWMEPLAIYALPIAPPGERKSAVLSALTRPVYEYEAERREQEAEEIAQNQVERAMLEKKLQAAQNDAAGKGGKKANAEMRREEALELAAQLANYKDKRPFRLLVDDTTPEKLVDIMEQQGECITVTSAEGGLFDTLTNKRYDGGASFDIYLKGHAGDPLTVDRIGRKGNHLKHPRLTLMLTVQPDVLRGLMDNAALRGRGLCGRFLYVMCKSKMGHRKVSPAPIPPEVKNAYRQFIRNILTDRGSGVIRLSPEADKVRQDYQAHIERKLGDEWEYMQDWGGKLVGATVRIAALFHAAAVPGNAADVPISGDTMAEAVKMAEFLGPHAEAAYQLMGASEDQDGAKYLLKRLLAQGKESVSRTELIRACRGKFQKAEDMDPALKILMDRGYIRAVEKAVGYNNRQQIEYFINPLL